jgi:hypothetical protein
LYWGYIVTKILTIYHSSIHPLHHSWKVYFGWHFWKFQSMTDCPIAFEPVARQYIMVGEHGRRRCLLHGGQKVKERAETSVLQSLLMALTPSDLRISTRPHVLKFLPPSNSTKHTIVLMEFMSWLWETVRNQASNEISRGWAWWCTPVITAVWEA